VGFSTDLRQGVAAGLNTAGIGVWRAATAYTATDTAIVLGTLPQAPDNAIALMTYPVSDDSILSDSVIGLQIRTRWTGQDSTKVDDLADLIFAYLHGKSDWTLSTGVRVVQCSRQSFASLGQDENGRWERSDNYYLWTWRPGTNRI
jgi:hypothetical protein